MVVGSIGRQTHTHKKGNGVKKADLCSRDGEHGNKLEAMLQSYTVVLQFKIFDNAFVLFAVHQYCKLMLDAPIMF